MAVVCVGEVVVDWISTDGAETFEAGGLFLRTLGGNASNTAIGLARLGTPASIVGQVGSDIHGRYLASVLGREGVNCEHLIVSGVYPTAQCYVITSRDGEQSYLNWPQPHAADMLSLSDLDVDALSGRALHATGISLTRDPRRQTVIALMRERAQKGWLVSFDACFPTGLGEKAAGAVHEAMDIAHLIKCNWRELIYWSGGSEGESIESMAARLFARYHPDVLVITLGATGSSVLTAEGMVSASAFAVEPVNSVGAGDAHAAGLLAGLSEHLGESLAAATCARVPLSLWQELAKMANAAGALATTTIGAWEGLPTRAELAAFMSSCT